jgi:type IX secretion system PorP/SprF family membrane protein
MLRKLLLGLFGVVAGFSAQAQDPMFSQFYANPLYLNPALAGSGGGARFMANIRSQYSNLPGSYNTYMASYDQRFDALSGGIGVQLFRDQSGQDWYTHQGASLIYSNHLRLDRKWNLLTGFQFTYSQKQLNWNNFVFGDQIDPRLGNVRPTQEVIPTGGQTNRNLYDFSAGMTLFSEKYYVGVAANHLTQPNQSLLPDGNSPLYMKLTAHAGMNIEVVKSTMRQTGLTISPNIIYQYQGGAQQLNLGLYAIRGPFVGGLWYRTTEGSVIALAGIQSGVFRFGYSYDVIFSNLNQAAKGSHEFSIGLQFEEAQKSNRRRMAKIKCPTF